MYKLRNESRKIESIVNSIDDKIPGRELSDKMNAIACLVDEMSSDIVRYEVEVE